MPAKNKPKTTRTHFEEHGGYVTPKNVKRLFREMTHSACIALELELLKIADDLRRNLKKFDDGSITGDELAHQAWGTEAWLRSIIIKGKTNGKK
jgi:hypothetical protein